MDLFNRNELPSLYNEGLPIPATPGTDTDGGGSAENWSPLRTSAAKR